MRAVIFLLLLTVTFLLKAQKSEFDKYASYTCLEGNCKNSFSLARFFDYNAKRMVWIIGYFDIKNKLVKSGLRLSSYQTYRVGYWNVDVMNNGVLKTIKPIFDNGDSIARQYYAQLINNNDYKAIKLDSTFFQIIETGEFLHQPKKNTLSGILSLLHGAGERIQYERNIADGVSSYRTDDMAGAFNYGALHGFGLHKAYKNKQVYITVGSYFTGTCKNCQINYLTTDQPDIVGTTTFISRHVLNDFVEPIGWVIRDFDFVDNSKFHIQKTSPYRVLLFDGKEIEGSRMPAETGKSVENLLLKDSTIYSGEVDKHNQPNGFGYIKGQNFEYYGLMMDGLPNGVGLYILEHYNPILKGRVPTFFSGKFFQGDLISGQAICPGPESYTKMTAIADSNNRVKFNLKNPTRNDGIEIINGFATYKQHWYRDDLKKYDTYEVYYENGICKESIITYANGIKRNSNYVYDQYGREIVNNKIKTRLLMLNDIVVVDGYATIVTKIEGSKVTLLNGVSFDTNSIAEIEVTRKFRESDFYIYCPYCTGGVTITKREGELSQVTVYGTETRQYKGDYLLITYQTPTVHTYYKKGPPTYVTETCRQCNGYHKKLIHLEINVNSKP